MKTFYDCLDICDASWIYYRGFCYERITSCETWTNASTTCMASSSNLAGIENAEEDVFVQHLHRGKPSWIGLNDQANEGVYLWADGGPVTYTHWGPGISSPPTNQEADCIHSSGRENSYIWQASSCNNCQNFTCKKGKLFDVVVYYRTTMTCDRFLGGPTKTYLSFYISIF